MLTGNLWKRKDYILAKANDCWHLIQRTIVGLDKPEVDDFDKAININASKMDEYSVKNLRFGILRFRE